ncbi:hypothetical protein [Chryseobacterium sp.]|uniref:hypothetical protein n=1 Tax=Chryseobacterium sp. TaxID=1871047 RepID=UPI0025BB627A|nr:hypothetical protein [Chryseobacterium sp.]MBV8326750.1 hypothetical protein [Chryseobacterium sp.]
MKIKCLTFVLVCFIACKNDQNKTGLQSSQVSADSSIVRKNSEAVPNAIEEIKKEYAILHSQLEANKFKSSTFTYDCDNEISGEIKYYSDQSEIRVIEHSYAEHDHFSGSERYFIKNGKVFFIFKEDTEWSFDGGTPEKPITRDDITERRVYLQNGQPIKCLEKKYSIRSNTPTPPSPDGIPGKEVICNTTALMKTYQSLINNKNQTGAVKKCL